MRITNFKKEEVIGNTGGISMRTYNTYKFLFRMSEQEVVGRKMAETKRYIRRIRTALIVISCALALILDVSAAIILMHNAGRTNIAISKDLFLAMGIATGVAVALLVGLLLGARIWELHLNRKGFSSEPWE